MACDLNPGPPTSTTASQNSVGAVGRSLEDRYWHRAAGEATESVIALLSQAKQHPCRVQTGDVVADGAGLGSAADEDAAFEVGFHGATGEVGAADERDLVVNHNDLRVQGRAGRAGPGGQCRRSASRPGKGVPSAV